MMILKQTTLGALFAIVAAAFLAAWMVYLQRAMERGGGPRLAVFTMAASFLFVCAPIALWLRWQGSLPSLNPTGIFLFIASGFLTAGIGPILISHATRRIGAARMAAVRLLDPLYAFAIAALFLGERLSAGAFTGVVLIVSALGLLQLDRRGSGPAGRQPGYAGGIAIAALASLGYAVGSIVRKAGLVVVPSTILAGIGEGTAGMLVALPLLVIGRRWDVFRDAFRRRHFDFWLSGLSAAVGALCLNLALERVAVPVAGALRNTSPWFALALVPLLLGRGQRPGRWTWASTALLTAGMLLIVLR